MLESNVNVFIFDNDINLIYRSSDEAELPVILTDIIQQLKRLQERRIKVIS